MERNIQKNGLINLLMLLAVGVAAFAVARYSNTLAGVISVIYLSLGILVAAVSWFQMRLEQSERLEKLELEEMARGRSGSALFDSKDAELFPARRAREQFERFFVPGFTILLALVEGGGAWLMWHWMPKLALAPDIKQPVAGMFMFLLFSLVLFLLGRFSATFARLENQRLLRPGASYLLLNAILCLAVGAGIIGVWAGRPKTDFYVAHALCLMLGLVAVETVVALLLEMYRPRVKGKVERPLYESRLVGLLGQPEGLITTAAQAVDYQFGFKVSETWFYQFFIRAVLWMVPLQLAALFLSTGVVVIEPGQQGLYEVFGQPSKDNNLLNPGLHLVWPWPMGQVYRFRTEQIQTFHVGLAENPALEGPVVVWTVSHNPKEENFLVAHHDTSALEATNSLTGKRTPPVSLLTVSVPVQYQITDLTKWAYKNEDAPSLLQDLGTREVVRYLAGVDMNEIMSSGRWQASQELVQRIQAAADDRQLGARIISVGLQDLHPPVKVAPEYEKVVGAIQTKQAKILAAEADQIRTNAMADAQAVGVVNKATSDRAAREIGAVAQAGLFTNQIPAFDAAPSVYAQRAYLQTFARATANARKFIMLTTNTHDVLTFDMKESVAKDLLTLKVPEPKK